MAVPASVSQIVEIGRRCIDISTIVFVLITLGFPELFLTPAVQEYCATIMPANYGTSFPYAKDRDFRGDMASARRKNPASSLLPMMESSRHITSWR